MFRNAEYRLGLSQSLSKGMLGPAEDESNTPKVSGEIQVKMGDQEIKVVMSHMPQNHDPRSHRLIPSPYHLAFLP